MIQVIGVRFKRTGKVYYFDPLSYQPQVGDGVIVETARGVEYGEVVMAPQEVEDKEIVSPLKPVIRVATREDRNRLEDNRRKEKEAFVIGEERIAAHNLDMKLVDVEYTFDGKKIIFYFTADGRVDFRDLVRDLASRFRTRIELRQIGVRDEAKMLGGLGPCGRTICCKTFMNDFVPVSIRMAKDQNISLNPTKISGLCGRLMCCLQFESQFYAQARSNMPRNGTDVMTPDGPGDVTDQHILKETVKVRVLLQDLTVEQREYPLEDIRVVSRDERMAAVAALESEHREEAVRREASREKAAQRTAAAQERAAARAAARQNTRPHKAESLEEREAQQAEAASRGREQGSRPPRRSRPQGEAAKAGAETQEGGKPREGRPPRRRGGRRRSGGNRPPKEGGATPPEK